MSKENKAILRAFMLLVLSALRYLLVKNNYAGYLLGEIDRFFVNCRKWAERD